jgi:hypothetical protein
MFRRLYRWDRPFPPRKMDSFSGLPLRGSKRLVFTGLPVILRRSLSIQSWSGALKSCPLRHSASSGGRVKNSRTQIFAPLSMKFVRGWELSTKEGKNFFGGLRELRWLPRYSTNSGSPERIAERERIQQQWKNIRICSNRIVRIFGSRVPFNVNLRALHYSKATLIRWLLLIINNFFSNPLPCPCHLACRRPFHQGRLFSPEHSLSQRRLLNSSPRPTTRS